VTLFRYDAAITARFPEVVGGIIVARGVVNGPTPRDLAAAYAAEQAATLARLGDTPLSQVPSLAAWRRFPGLRGGPDAIPQRGGGAAASADEVRHDPEP